MQGAGEIRAEPADGGKLVGMGVDVAELIVVGGVIAVAVGVEHHQRQGGDLTDHAHKVTGFGAGVQQKGPLLPHDQEAADDLLFQCPYAGADPFDCGVAWLHGRVPPCILELEVIDTGLEDGLVLAAIDVLADELTGALGVAHLAQHSAVGEVMPSMASMEPLGLY